MITGTMKTQRRRLAPRKILFYGVVSYLWLFPVFYLFAPGPLGMLEAKYDLWHGRYAKYSFGYPSPDAFLSAEILLGYGIRWRWMGCTIDHFRTKYAKGYNSIMKKAIAKKFPREVVEQAMRLAW